MSKSKGSIQCPACHQPLAPRRIHEHTSQCKAWAEQFGDPVPKFKYDPFVKHRKPLYKTEAVEGVDYVQCKICAEYGWDFRFSRMTQHIKAHGLIVEDYQARFPNAAVRLQKTTDKRRATTRERYGVDNVAKLDEVKEKTRETLQERYGGQGLASPVLKAKVVKTNQERYGVDNPFQLPEVQAKIRERHLEKHGVEFPNQRPEVMAKRIATNLERYGVEHFVETDAFQEIYRQISQERYGTDHPMQSELGFQRCTDVIRERYGTETPFHSDEVQRKAYETILRNHGGVHHLSLPETIERRKQNLMAKYGVDNISKVPAVKAKIIRTIKERFRTGAIPTMTTPERIFDDMPEDRIVFSGDWSYWVQWKDGRRKNPDFVVLTSEQYKAYEAGVPLNQLRTWGVIEVNGDFWHTRYRGLTREEREKEFVEGYASVNVSCLVVWESDLDRGRENVVGQVEDFIS